MKLPAYVKNCIDALTGAGFSAYAVGGAVRDSLLGVSPSDWDVTTSALPEQTLTVFADRRTIPTGIKHGTITVLCEENGIFLPIEVTTFRIDGEYLDSRHPESVLFSRDLRDDLSRRDFTVNAMAYNEVDGLIDAFGGMGDLERKIIRTVGVPEARFTEDALRIMRAFRFSAQLGFEIDENTLSGAQKCAHLLKNIARERVGVEFKKLLASKKPSYSLLSMVHLGVWDSIFSGIDAPSEKIISKIDHLPESFEVRLACLTCELDTNSLSSLLDSLRLSNDEKRLSLRLREVKNFDFDGNAEVCARRFLHLYNNIFDLALSVLGFFACGEKFESFKSAVISERQKSNPLSISDLKIRGGDILPLCENDYSLVGKALSHLLALVVDNPALNEREQLINEAKNFIKMNIFA